MNTRTIRGVEHRLVVLKLVGRWPDGRPKECVMVHDDQSTDVQDGTRVRDRVRTGEGRREEDELTMSDQAIKAFITELMALLAKLATQHRDLAGAVLGLKARLDAIEPPRPPSYSMLGGRPTSACQCAWTNANGARQDGTIGDALPGLDPCAGHRAAIERAWHNGRHFQAASDGRGATEARVPPLADLLAPVSR
jgi:hypothetical protein